MGFLTENYLLIKQLHIATALFSITLFIIRFFKSQQNPLQIKNRWLRVLPHLNDSLLLTFAILLCFSIQQAPLINPWLSEKVSAVFLYIISGMFALKWAKNRWSRNTWFVIACVMFAYTANIAMNKNPLVFQ